MKNIKSFSSGLLLVLIFSAAAFAQTEKTLPASKGKVAIVQTFIFEDTDRGIEKLREALKNVYSEDQSGASSFQARRVSFEVKRKDLQKEMDSLLAENKPVNEVYLKIKSLDFEFSRTLNKRNAELSSKYKSSVLPVYEAIKKKAKEFAELKGYSMVIENQEINFLYSREVDDVTLEFIKFCNESFEKEKSTNK